MSIKRERPPPSRIKCASVPQKVASSNPSVPDGEIGMCQSYPVSLGSSSTAIAFRYDDPHLTAGQLLNAHLDLKPGFLECCKRITRPRAALSRHSIQPFKKLNQQIPGSQ